MKFIEGLLTFHEASELTLLNFPFFPLPDYYSFFTLWYYSYLWVLQRWQQWVWEVIREKRMLIRALVSTHLMCNEKLIRMPLKTQPSFQPFFFSRGLTYPSMKLFSFFEHVFDQRAMEPIHGESIRVICICIITILSSLQKAKYNAILLSN